MAVTKIWAWPVDGRVWLWSWVGGSLAAGLLSAAAWTFVVRRKSLDAAIEMDRRFRLKERVSSTLALTPAEADTDIGRALITDAVRRVERLDVADKFRVRAGWKLMLPLAPAAVVFLLTLMADATHEKSSSAANAASIKEQIVVTLRGPG